MRLTDELGVTQEELAMLLRPLFPAASKAAVSLAERTKTTGVQFHPAAAKLAREQTGRVKRPPKRKHGHRVTLWLDEPMLDFLHRESGGNINALLRGVIIDAMRKGGFDLSADSEV